MRTFIHQQRLWFEKSATRNINPNYHNDILRLRQIDNNENVLRWMDGNPMSHKEIKEFAQHEPKRYIYGVSGSKLADRQELGELQGWVQFYNHSLLPSLIKQCFLDKPHTIYYDISFAKFPSTENGQISSALRQLCYEFTKNDLFPQEKEYTYCIVAFSDIDNQKSIQVLNSAGFVSQDKLVKWDDHSREAKDVCFVLDPRKLNEALIKKEQIAKTLASYIPDKSYITTDTFENKIVEEEIKLINI